MADTSAAGGGGDARRAGAVVPSTTLEGHVDSRLKRLADQVLAAEEAALMPAHTAAVAMSAAATRARAAANAARDTRLAEIAAAPDLAALRRAHRHGRLSPAEGAVLRAVEHLTRDDTATRDPGLRGLDTAYRDAYAAGTLDSSGDLVARIAHARARVAEQAGHRTYADMVLRTQTVGTPAAVERLVAAAVPPVLAALRQPPPAPRAPDPAPAAEVLRAVADTAHRLWGVRVAPDRHTRPPHPDARVWEVRDGGRLLGRLVLDLHARPGKRGGAWTKPLSLTGRVVSVQANLTGGVCTAAQAATLHHEILGHAAHYLAAEVAHPLLAGTYTLPHDAREVHGVVAEHWAPGPARGPLTDPAGYHAFLQSVALDHAWHTLDAAQGVVDVDEFERDALDRAGLLHPGIQPRYPSRRFRHIWTGGYAARYYSYLHADTVAADITAAMPAVDRATGGRWRAVLAAGSERDLPDLVAEFTGHPTRNVSAHT